VLGHVPCGRDGATIGAETSPHYTNEITNEWSEDPKVDEPIDVFVLDARPPGHVLPASTAKIVAFPTA
jgi:hypothetical protein